MVITTDTQNPMQGLPRATPELCSALGDISTEDDPLGLTNVRKMKSWTVSHIFSLTELLTNKTANSPHPAASNMKLNQSYFMHLNEFQAHSDVINIFSSAVFSLNLPFVRLLYSTI